MTRLLPRRLKRRNALAEIDKSVAELFEALKHSNEGCERLRLLLGDVCLRLDQNLVRLGVHGDSTSSVGRTPEGRPAAGSASPDSAAGSHLPKPILDGDNPREQDVDALRDVLQGAVDLLQQDTVRLDVLRESARKLRHQNLEGLSHPGSVGPDGGDRR